MYIFPPNFSLTNFTVENGWTRCSSARLWAITNTLHSCKPYLVTFQFWLWSFTWKKRWIFRPVTAIPKTEHDIVLRTIRIVKTTFESYSDKVLSHCGIVLRGAARQLPSGFLPCLSQPTKMHLDKDKKKMQLARNIFKPRFIITKKVLSMYRTSKADVRYWCIALWSVAASRITKSSPLPGILLFMPWKKRRG